MSPLLVALLGVLLVPLFVATWRSSLAGLSLQGLLMAWIAYGTGPAPDTANDWVTLADLVLVRGLWAPVALYGVLRAQNAPARNDVIPPNLLSWTAALGLVLVAFNFSEMLVRESGDQQTLVAVVVAGIMLGFLVLATQSDPFSQMMGALRIENAIALLELGGERHHQPLGVQLAQTAIVSITIAFYRWYLATLSAPAPTPGSLPESPTL
jgi:hydrogenase-4 membrane subunit HyfE